MQDFTSDIGIVELGLAGGDSTTISGTVTLHCVLEGTFAQSIDVPADQPTSGPGVGSQTRLQIFDGAPVEAGFQAGPADGTGTNVVVNVFDGAIAPGFNANAGSSVSIYEGSVANPFKARASSAVTLLVRTFSVGGVDQTPR